MSNPYSPGRDSNAASGKDFDQDGDEAFANGALAAEQLDTSGHDRQSSPAPSRFTYPTPGPGGRLVD